MYTSLIDCAVSATSQLIHVNELRELIGTIKLLLNRYLGKVHFVPTSESYCHQMSQHAITLASRPINGILPSYPYNNRILSLEIRFKFIKQYVSFSFDDFYNTMDITLAIMS